MGGRALLESEIKDFCWCLAKMENESLLLPAASGRDNLTMTPCYESSKLFLFKA